MTFPVEHLECYETHLGCKVIERLRVSDDWSQLDVVLIGPEVLMALAPDWRREQGRVWP